MGLRVKKAMDDAQAAKRVYREVGRKDVCLTCKFFSRGGSEAKWGACHSPAFNRSIQVVTPRGRQTLDDVGGSFVRVAFSCPYYKRRGDVVFGTERGPWG